MMDFVTMTLSFTVAILLASGLACAVLLNKKVFKWYMKKAQKVSSEVIEELYDNDEETV